MRLTEELIAYTRKFLRSDIRQTKRDVDEYYAFEKMEVPAWLKTQAI